MPIGPNGERLPYPGDPGGGGGALEAMLGGGGGMFPGAPEMTSTGDPELDDALMGSPEDEEELEGGAGIGDPLEFLRTAIDSLQEYIDAEDDDVNISQALKFQAGISSILAGEQKALETATGVTPAAKVVARRNRQV